MRGCGGSAQPRDPSVIARIRQGRCVVCGRSDRGEAPANLCVIGRAVDAVACVS